MENRLLTRTEIEYKIDTAQLKLRKAVRSEYIRDREIMDLRKSLENLQFSYKSLLLKAVQNG